MSRPTQIAEGPAASARGSLPEAETAAFDRLAHAVLASSTAPLGALLRSQLPGTAGVRWLHQENLSPTARPTDLTSAQWLSLFGAWTAVHRAPSPRGPGGRNAAGRPSGAHGHAPGAAGIPRWGQ